MRRTQIYLDDEIIQVLKVESRVRGKRMSELIREALRKEYMGGKLKLSVIDELAGLWSGRRFDVERYVRGMRRGKRMRVLYGG